ncbi:hypothetical protein INT45_000718, partial [Circinella minor]
YVDFHPANSGKNVGLKHVWDILKEEPKWKPQVPKPNNEAEAVDGTTKRPIGKHKAKENKEKRRANDKESAEVQAQALETCPKQMLMAKHEIMKVNLHGLSNQQQEYYRIMQKHILDELKEEMESPKKKQKEMVNVEDEDEEEEEKGDGEEEEEEGEEEEEEKQ